MFDGLLLGAILFISWLFLGGVTIILACLLCYFVLHKIAGDILTTVCASLIGIAVGAFLTAYLSGAISILYFPSIRIETVHRVVLMAGIVGGVLGGWLAILFMDAFSVDHN